MYRRFNSYCAYTKLKFDKTYNKVIKITKICPQCDVEYPYYMYPWICDNIQVSGICETCYEENKGLVKRTINDKTFYVPWNTEFNIRADKKTNKVNEEPILEEHKSIRLPELEWDKKYNKWKLSLLAPDFAGYDCEEHYYYFDTIEDMITVMKQNK